MRRAIDRTLRSCVDAGSRAICESTRDRIGLPSHMHHLSRAGAAGRIRAARSTPCVRRAVARSGRTTPRTDPARRAWKSMQGSTRRHPSARIWGSVRHHITQRSLIWHWDGTHLHALLFGAVRNESSSLHSGPAMGTPASPAARRDGDRFVRCREDVPNDSSRSRHAYKHNFEIAVGRKFPHEAARHPTKTFGRPSE